MYNWRSKTLSIPCHFKILDLKTKKFKDVVDAGNLKLNFTKNAVFKTRAQAIYGYLKIYRRIQFNVQGPGFKYCIFSEI